VEGAVGNSYRVDKKGWIEYGDQFSFERDQPFTVSAWLRLKPEGGSPFGKMESSGNIRGWDVEFHGTKPSVHLISQWPANAIHFRASAICRRIVPACGDLRRLEKGSAQMSERSARRTSSSIP
jgi:hypothetical protein